MRIDDYFSYLENVINETLGVVSAEIFKDKRSENTGFFKASIHFRNQKVLHVREFVYIDKEVKRAMYAYHFQDKDGNLIFRYDNTEHHPHISTYPHHKHTPHEILPSSIPTLKEVLREIIIHLEFDIDYYI